MRALQIVSLLALAACGGGSAPCPTSAGTSCGSCDITIAGQCVDFAGLSGADLSTVQALCKRDQGLFGATLCQSPDRIGSCQLPPTTPGTGVTTSSATVELRYYAPRYSLATATKACAGAPGTTFTAN